MNWTHREFSEIGPASTLITTLVGETDNINVGRIESNTLSSEVDADLGPQRIGDAIMKIVSAGDASGNLWKGGVYANQYEESYQGSPNQFVYEPVPTTVDYELQGGKIYRTGGLEFPISQFLPGVYVRDTQAPPREKPPGSSNVWDDPQVSYCNECEFIWPNTLRLKFPGLRQSVATTAPSLFDVPGMGGGPHRRPWRTGGHGGAGPPRLPSTSGAGGGPFPPTGGAGSGPFPPTGTAGGAHDLPLPDDEWIGGYEPV
jgi:hypothetical protein